MDGKIELFHEAICKPSNSNCTTFFCDGKGLASLDFGTRLAGDFLSSNSGRWL